MSRKVVALATGLVVLAAAAAFAFNPDELNKVTFQNKTGTKIQMIFLSPGDSDWWGPDLIGADYVMKDSSTLGYYVHYPDKSFKFDILAVDDKGDKFEVYDYVLTDGKEATISFTQKNLTGKADDFTLATVELTNTTGNEIEYLFISPEDSKAWGSDLLDSETTLADGDSHSVVIPVGDKETKYNIMAVDENNDEYQFTIKLAASKEDTYTYSIEPADKQ